MCWTSDGGMLIKHIIISLLLVIVVKTYVDFVIIIPAAAPLYMKADTNTITTFSGGELTLSNGVYILSYP